MDKREALDNCQYWKAEQMTLRHEQRYPVFSHKRSKGRGERFDCPRCGTVGYEFGAERECPFCFLKWGA